MGILRLVFLLLTTLGLAGTAQAVPALGNLLLQPGVENYGRGPGNGVTGVTTLSGSAGVETVGKGDDASYGMIAAPGFGFGCDDSLVQCFVLPPSDCLPVYKDTNLKSEFSANSNKHPLSNPSNDVKPSSVPEPDTMILLGSGLLVLAGIGRRFTRN